MTRDEARIPFFLLWRHLRRGNTWTILLIVFLMAIAFINLIFVTSLFQGIIDGTNKQIINVATGHVVITPSNERSSFSDVNALLDTVRRIPNVQGASARATLPARFSFGDRQGSWSVIAIRPDAERTVTHVHDRMIAGSYLNEDDADGIILGRQIAGGADVEGDPFSLKGVEVGDAVDVEINGSSHAFFVRGVFSTKFLDTDEGAFLTSTALERHYPALSGIATSVLVRLSATGDEGAFVARLASMNVQENVYTWEDAAGMMKSITKSFLSINVILSFVAILIAAVTIFIVVYIDISNKKREIGILRAIGIKPSVIQWAYILQTVFYSFAGMALGSALFFAVIYPYFVAHPFQLPIVDASLSFSAADLIARIESIFVVSILAGLIPSVHFTRIKLLDAIWGSR
jgi:putative ABC transport system permease protein